MPLALLALLACPALAASPQKVSFKTPDGWTIQADYRPPRGEGPVMVLVHGVASSKNEWTRFAVRLSSEGVGILALDLRGHGDSTHGPNGNRGYEDFDATGEWAKASADLKAAAAWLESRGVAPSRIAFGGASIGADLASEVAAGREKTPFLLLLSPGPDYRGVRLVARPGLPTFVCAAPRDAYAFQTLGPFSKMKAAETLSAPAGHGVQVFDDPATFERIVGWVLARSRLSGARKARR